MSFEERLKKVEDSLDKKEINSFQKGDVSFKDLALRASSDMVSSLIVGSLLGWTVDDYKGTFPYGIIGGFLLGTLAGLLTVYKTLLKKIK